MIPDLRRLPPEADAERFRRADAVRAAADVPGFPVLRYWNYAPCAAHTALEPGCAHCGGVFRKHQRVGAMWLWLVKRGLQGDPTGTGKTLSVLGLLAMLKESGELAATAPGRRAVVIAGAVEQWRDEAKRFIPSLQVITGTGTVDHRAARYADPWELLVISPETLRLRQIKRKNAAPRRAGDLEIIQRFRPGIVVYDDVDAMRHASTQVAYAINKLAESADRVVGVHATPVQKRPLEAYDFLLPVGGAEAFGSRALFTHRFVEVEEDYYEARDRYGHKVVKSRKREARIKNGAELKRLVAPMVLRRTVAQLDDVEMPDLVPNTVWLEGSPAQKARYAELKKGVLRMIRDNGQHVTAADAGNMWLRGWQICSGLATLDGEQRGDSVKLDWLEDKLSPSGDFAEDKVVVFVNFTNNVADLQQRLERMRVGHVIRWGRQIGRAQRHADLVRFREDPACRVLVGTTTIERSLNLQVARHMVAIDSLCNPARMRQLAGRTARVGSPLSTVYFHSVLLRGTQEEALPELLAAEQGMADWLWGERSDLYPPLSPMRLLAMISGDPEVARLAQAASR